MLGINEDPVSIKQIEMAIADRGFEEGWIVPEPPELRTGKRVAVIGGGPAGLAAAQQLNRAGHWVTVFERADRPGGLLMYGIPDFKLEKDRVWRRIRQLEAEGVEFRCNANVGGNVETAQLREEYDAMLLTGGATQPRDLPIPGRNFPGVHYAMEFLPQQNKRNQGDAIPADSSIMATDKDVIVIGGGDTGSDCTGTSNRHRARSVTQFELLPKPPDLGYFPRATERPTNSPWPYWTMMLRTSSSHKEGCDRHWSVLTKEFQADEQGKVKALVTVEIEWYADAQGRQQFKEIAGTTKVWPCQLRALGDGISRPEKRGAIADLGLELDARGNVKCDANYMASVEGVFAAGDIRRGQSLVVWGHPRRARSGASRRQVLDGRELLAER